MINDQAHDLAPYDRPAAQEMVNNNTHMIIKISYKPPPVNQVSVVWQIRWLYETDIYAAYARGIRLAVLPLLCAHELI